MKKINLICPKDAVHRVRNCLPTGKERIGDIQFSINGEERQYDGLIVLQSTSMYRYENQLCREGNSLMIVREPQDILRMPARYIDQFSHLLTPNPKVRGKHTIHGQFGQLWTLDYSYQELASMSAPEKTRFFSTVTSAKALTKGHVQRVELLEKIQLALPEQLDWFGRGVREINNKWDAIETYRYHLVFENGRWPDYWTEKLTDAFLGFSMPIYLGCQNIKAYFPEESMVDLNSVDSNVVIPQLKRLLEVDKYKDSSKQINLARDKVITEYSLVNVLIRLIERHFNLAATQYTEVDFGKFSNIAYRSSIKKIARKGIKKIAGRKH